MQHRGGRRGKHQQGGRLRAARADLVRDPLAERPQLDVGAHLVGLVVPHDLKPSLLAQLIRLAAEEGRGALVRGEG